MGWDLLGRTAQRLNYWSCFWPYCFICWLPVSHCDVKCCGEALVLFFFTQLLMGGTEPLPAHKAPYPSPPGWLSGDDSTSWITWTGEQLRCWPTCRAVTCYRMKIDLTGGLRVETQHLCEYWFYLRENVKGSIPLLVPVWEVKLKWL